MDWKDILSQKVAEGALPHEEISQQEPDLTKSGQTDTLSILIDKKGRKGKIATLIVGFTIDDEEVKRIATTLKTRLGTGGSARGGEILIQGDRRDDVKAHLIEMGYKVKG